MKASIEEINSVQKRLKVTVSSEAVDKAFDKAYSRLRKKAKIQGYRPGKAPLYVLKKMYNSTVSYEVGEELINENLYKAIDSEGVKPVASPFVEMENAPAHGEEYSFSAVVDIMPKIELNDQHKALNVSCKEYKSDDSTLEKELKNIARRKAKTETLDDSVAADKGHLAFITHSATVDGEADARLNTNNTPVMLGEGELLKELEEHVLGMKKGESKEQEITLPEDFAEPSLSGKKAVFSLTLDNLLGVQIPEINDELAKDLNFDNLDKMKEEVKRQLEETSVKMTKNSLESGLLGDLLKKVSFEVPPAMVDQVIDSMINEHNFKSEDDRKKALKDKDIRSSLRPEARQKAQNTMLLWEVIKAEDLKIEDAEIRTHVEKFVEEGSENSEEQIQETIKQFGERIRENLLFEKAMTNLAEKATIQKSQEVL